MMGIKRSLCVLALAAPSLFARPFKYPLPNGFPNPSEARLAKISDNAGGTLSNAPGAPTLSEDGKTSLRLIAFNELFEVAFFTQFLRNVTRGVPGFEIPDGLDREFVVESLRSIKAQEQLHALNANNALKGFEEAVIEPCEYVFPVTNFLQGIQFASTFTDVVLGTLQDAIQVFAKGAEDGRARGVAASLGNEGEQNGWYRTILGKEPSSAPFLTAGARAFAFNAIQKSLNGRDSCPNIDEIALPTYSRLELLSTDVSPDTETLKFSIPGGDVEEANSGNVFITYISGQNLPVTRPVEVAQDGTVTADSPWREDFARGLTIAALTDGEGPFTSATAVAAATLWGPALIQVQ